MDGLTNVGDSTLPFYDCEPRERLMGIYGTGIAVEKLWNKRICR
jgi:hypothetical protein